MINKNTSYDNIAVWWQFAERSAMACNYAIGHLNRSFKILKIITYEQIKRNSN